MIYATKKSVYYTFTLEKHIKKDLRQIKDLAHELTYSDNIYRRQFCINKIDACQKRINTAINTFEIDYKKCTKYNLKLDSYRTQISKP
jgi:hypothetical protein